MGLRVSVNRFPEVRSIIQGLTPELRETVDVFADRHFNRVKRAIKAHQPVQRASDLDPIPGRDPRPSVRRGYTPIEDGWIEWSDPASIESTTRLRPDIAEEARFLFGYETSTRRVEATRGLSSRSKHIDWQRFGIASIAPHVPVDAPLLYFWWGPPLRWGPRDAPGPRRMHFTDHAGFPPHGGSDFVERAVAIEDAQAESEFDMVGHTVFSRLQTFFGQGRDA